MRRQRFEREREIVASTETARRDSSRGSDRRCAPGRRNVPLGRRQIRRLLLEDRRHRVGGGLAAGTRAGPPASRRAPRRRRRCRRGDRPAGRAPARAPCSRPCRAPCPASVSDLRRSRRRGASGAVDLGSSFARPKSRILTRPSSVMKMFSGLRSRWTMPLSCAAASPRAIWTA